MKYQDLENLAIKGQLEIHKYNVGQFNRSKYIYSENEDILKQKLLRIEKVPYTRYYYSARTPSQEKHQGYKITSKDYRLLLKAGAKEV